MTRRIVILDQISDRTLARMTALLPDGFTLDRAPGSGEAEQCAAIATADYAISGQIAVPGPVLRASRQLRVLHKWGVGTDNLDLAAARELGIQVARTTGSNAVPVAEFTVGLMIATLRHLGWAYAELREGRWQGGRLPADTYLLSGKTVGLIGFGAIGRTVARLLAGFGCQVLYHAPTRRDPADEAALGATHATLPDLLAASDIVSLHCPLTPQTRDMIGAAAFARMKRTAILVNVARGGIVVEADLVEALRGGVIHGAATDVFSTEPPPPDNPLLALPNCLVTPHIAASSADTFAPTIRQMFANFQAVESGGAIPERDRVV